MKQLSAIIATLLTLHCLCLHAGEVRIWPVEWLNNQNVTMTTVVDAESEWVANGKKQAQATLSPGSEISIGIGEGEFYTGFQANLPIRKKHGYSDDEVDLYFGYSLPITDVFSMDLGYAFHWHLEIPHIHNNVNRSNELHLGFVADVPLAPAFYCFYNVNLEQFVIETSLTQSFELDDWGLPGFAMNASVAGSWLTARAYNGDQRDPGIDKQKNSYFYTSCSLGLDYTINEHMNASLTANYAFNSDGTAVVNGSPMNIGNHEKLLWWSGRITLVF